ncbi:hypothetical protein [Methylorubrum salsuginis]|uniref:Uncharacterized protein n=1 Tax=Methylorubrum salsuginis TaxID=414703 RepID=A0A1I4MYV6_9HYPH|nr:hypothetical protein [Methylorubrum salsuginis]SFM08469.1 hypothetical protein SAMN04488125_1494 [Methylorubrum salsuginis]
MILSRITRALMLAIVASSTSAQAGVITDFLDRIGGCRKPLHESFSYEISPYTPKPYGKALSDWTEADMNDFRAYFVACQARRPNWDSMGAADRADEIRRIDTAMAELRYKVGDARASSARQRADEATGAERQRRAETERRAEAEAAAQQAQIVPSEQHERTRRNEAARGKVVQLLKELLAFTQNELAALPPAEQLVRLDGYLARMEAVERETAGTPAAAPLAAMLGPTRTLRDQVAAAQSRREALNPSQPNTSVSAGPYTDFEMLGQRVVSAMTNPMQREAFRTSLAQGIDFNVGVSAIEPTPTGWLVQLSGRLGMPGTPGQGFFCRVERHDAPSVAVLRTVTPPHDIVHVTAPDTEEFVLESRPLLARIVFGPCRITVPSDRSLGSAITRFGRGTSALPPQPNSAEQTGEETDAPVAPSSAGLNCTTRPPRNDAQRAMAHRIRQVWAIPEALRADASLLLTFAVTLNYDAEVTAPLHLVRSQSQTATPAQLQAAVEAGHRAIGEAAPFPELGTFAGGTMQVDLTPCD